MNKKITVASVIMVSFLIMGAGYEPNPKTKLNTNKEHNTKITNQKDRHQKIKNKLQFAPDVNTSNKIEQKLCNHLSKEKIDKLNSISADKIKEANNQYKEKWNNIYPLSKQSQQINLGNKLTVEVMQNNKKAEQIYSNITNENEQKTDLEVKKQIQDRFKVMQNFEAENQAKYFNDGTLLILENKASFAIKSSQGNHEYRTAREIRKNIAKNLEDRKEIYSSIIKHCKR